MGDAKNKPFFFFFNIWVSYLEEKNNQKNNQKETKQEMEASAGVSGSRRRRRRRRRGRRSRVKTTDEDRKTLSESVAGARCTDPTFVVTASEPEETITSQSPPETLATTTKPVSVPVPQGISEEIVKLVKDRIDFLEAVEAAKCSTWYRQIMEIIQKSKNPQKKKKTPQKKKKKKKKKS